MNSLLDQILELRLIDAIPWFNVDFPHFKVIIDYLENLFFLDFQMIYPEIFIILLHFFTWKFIIHKFFIHPVCVIPLFFVDFPRLFDTIPWKVFLIRLFRIKKVVINYQVPLSFPIFLILNPKIFINLLQLFT